MNSWIRISRTVPIVACLAATLTYAQSPESLAIYEQQVQPVLAKHCLSCHGPDEQESQLRIDRRSLLLRGGDWGEASIVPGEPEKSFLFRVVSGLESDLRMPPEGESLTAIEIDSIRKWIATGAAMPVEVLDEKRSLDHWSYQPIRRPAIESPSAIDELLIQQLKQHEMTFSPQADRSTLIRRLYLVMLGLLPTPEEVAAFVNDPREDAWEQLVDSVLQSPHYGERWARHWLDLVRFGETHGFETNRERPHAWRYRDWVIAAFNNDKPYNDFIREQIAGDALGEPIATGFLVAGPHDLVKSPDINLTLMQRQDELSDLINATGTSILGLTLGCARCHNHKFDPITQKDFYAIQAVFAGVQHSDRNLPMPEEQQNALANVDRQIAALKSQLVQFVPKSSPSAVRPPVDFARNEELFPATLAKFVRFTVLKTTGGQPCLDELAVFSADQNIALASYGSIARSSSNLPGYEIHKLEHINDGKYGNAHSWISNESGGGWVQIEFPDVISVDRVEWGRDREGRYTDRLATEYEIAVSIDEKNWNIVASHRDRQPLGASSEVPAYDFTNAAPDLAHQGKTWLQELKELEQRRKNLAEPPKAYAGTFSQPGPTHRLYRGEPTAKREEVAPDTIESLGSLELEANSPEQQRRLAFADFLCRPENPLTARVIVNRLWQFHFGTGIVATPSDFGANGVPPTHPELLDWLASELIANQWSLKHIHRKILLSQAWQQTSQPNPDALAIDASTSLIWRFPPRRLEAEAIRDCVLAASGVLDLRMGGPGYDGFEVELENVRHFHPKTSYGPADWRRMIYMTKVRQEQDSVFGIFDCPDASQVIAQRSRSTTPLQALNLLNSIFVLQQSELLENRLKTDVGESLEANVHRAFEICFSRSASERELAASTEFVAQHGLTQFCRALFNSNEFLFIQ